MRITRTPSNASEKPRTPDSGYPKERSFLCKFPNCGHTRAGKGGLKDHYHSKHAPGYNFLCEHCDAEICTATAMIKHMEEHPEFEDSRGSGNCKSMVCIENERIAAQKGWLEVPMSTIRKRDEEALNRWRANPQNVSQDGRVINNVPVWWVQEGHTDPMPPRLPAARRVRKRTSRYSLARRGSNATSGNSYAPGTTGSSQGPARYHTYRTGEFRGPVDLYGVGNGGNLDYYGLFNFFPRNTNSRPSEASNNMLQYDDQYGYTSQHSSIPPPSHFSNSYAPPQQPAMPVPAPAYMGYYEDFDAAAAADVYSGPVASTLAHILDDGSVQQWSANNSDYASYFFSGQSW